MNDNNNQESKFVRFCAYVFVIVTLIVMLFSINNMKSHGCEGDYETPIVVKYNNVEVNFALYQQPILHEGRVYLPIRKICEIFGCAVIWNDATQEIDISDTYRKVRVKIGYDWMKVNGHYEQITAVPFIRNNTSYLPLRVIANTFGKDIAWTVDEKVKMITLSDY